MSLSKCPQEMRDVSFGIGKSNGSTSTVNRRPNIDKV
jgi:hypothetical protein